jgi:hypothetical protein
MTQQQHHVMAKCLGNAIASMTRQQHHATTNVALAAPSDSAATSRHSQRRFDSIIASMTRQRHHQHDSATTSRHGQCRLDSAIANMTWQRRHTTANVASPVPSPA